MKHTCQCCGYKTHLNEDNNWEICEVCFWQTCPIGNVEITTIVGPNPISLVEAQHNFIRFGACDKTIVLQVRKPKIDEPKDENWKVFDLKYFKRDYEKNNQKHSEITQQFFECDLLGDVKRQIQRLINGKVFKFNEQSFQVENGEVAQKPIDVNDKNYLIIDKTVFEEIWDKEFSNTHLVKQLDFDAHWEFAWNHINYNKTEQELFNGNFIIKGSYKDIFLLEVEYLDYSNYLMYNISEGRSNIKYGTVDNWDELVSSVQIWIDYIQSTADIVYSKPKDEIIKRQIKVMLEGVQKDASFSMYRNMDQGIEKFRGAYLSIGSSNFEHINTYIGVEDLMIDLQKSLPENIKIQSCFFCRFSSYNVAGNGNFGCLNCFKHCKKEILAVKSKDDMIDLWQTEYSKVFYIEETFHCDEFEEIQKGDYVFKSQVK